jgi:homogentisate 1,2-dioxygenase
MKPKITEKKGDWPAPVMTTRWDDWAPNPNQIRWLPFKMPEKSEDVDFISGIATVCGAGDTRQRMGGIAVHIYTCNRSMKDAAFNNSDGDMLFVPQQGAIILRTGMHYLVAFASCVPLR